MRVNHETFHVIADIACSRRFRHNITTTGSNAGRRAAVTLTFKVYLPARNVQVVVNAEDSFGIDVEDRAEAVVEAVLVVHLVLDSGRFPCQREELTRSKPRVFANARNLLTGAAPFI